MRPDPDMKKSLSYSEPFWLCSAPEENNHGA